jgi:RNA polymerase sigma factor (sigma-70 family)
MAEFPQTSAGDAHPAAIAYRAYAESLCAMGVKMCGVPSQDVEPLLNDVFVSYLRHHTRVRNERAWLAGAMRNACAEYWRRKGDFRRAEAILGTDPAASYGEFIEAQVDLRRALAKLSERCRRVLLLRFYFGLSSTELAAVLAVSPNNAKQLVHRCKAAARRFFVDGQQRDG